NDGSFSLSDGTNVYNTVKAPVDYLFENAVSDGSVIECTIKRPESKQGELQLNEKAPDPYTTVKARFEYEDTLYPCIKLTMSSEAFFEKSFLYPPAFDAKAGQTHILPYNEGVAIDADDPNDDVSLYEPWKGYNCGFIDMSFWGLTDGKRDRYVMTAVETSQDFCLRFHRDGDGLFRTYMYFEPQKSHWGYDRIVRFSVGCGGATDMAKKYRSLVEKRGFVRTLKEKAKAVPNVDRMIGAADTWVFNSDAMYKLYDKNAKYSRPTDEQYAERRRVADDMKKRGIDRVMWSIFDENLDSETLEYVKSKGYLTTVYEVFADVIQRPMVSLMTEARVKRCESRLSYWPDGIAVDKDGCLMKAWQLMGKDGRYYYQSRMCDEKCVDLALERIPSMLEKYKLDGWFLDVVYGTAFECYSPEHPTTRTQSMDAKRRLTKLIEELGLVCGTEIGREDGVPYVVYNEGMLSINEWRANQAGRRMATVYELDEIDDVVKKYSLGYRYRVPLWELVFHDCMISYWYWGDSHNCCPDLMPLRDLFLNLYGLPPLFSFSVDNWDRLADKIERSYKNTSPLAKEVGYEKMTSFEYLSDDFSVQRTAFSNGVRVTVNFGDDDFTLAAGRIVPAKGKIVERN
ncbi:MAG: hypothetical protein KBT31_02960, partial [Firmicutes bacterium]|nr:hypothetical protein [Candidatus Colimorpha enterica]